MITLKNISHIKNHHSFTPRTTLDFSSSTNCHITFSTPLRDQREKSEMGSEVEDSEQSSAPKLPLFSLPASKSAESFAVMGMITPPHHSASVPFRWEEEPGKPRPCKSLFIPSTNTSLFKGLELPPRLLYESKFTKTPSPTTVLEGPYVGRSIFHSLRLLRHREGSFDGGESGGSSPDKGLFGAVGISRRWLLHRKDKGGKKEFVDEGSFVFSLFSGEGEGGGDSKEEVTRISANRKGRLLGLTKARSNFWATIYGAMKQVIPSPRRNKWKN